MRDRTRIQGIRQFHRTHLIHRTQKGDLGIRLLGYGVPCRLPAYLLLVRLLPSGYLPSSSLTRARPLSLGILQREDRTSEPHRSRHRRRISGPIPFFHLTFTCIASSDTFEEHVRTAELCRTEYSGGRTSETSSTIASSCPCRHTRHTYP